MSHECTRCTELSTAVDHILEKLVNLTHEQLALFRSEDYSAFMRLDKELELTVGLKERTLGALREHRRDHGDAAMKAS